MLSALLAKHTNQSATLSYTHHTILQAVSSNNLLKSLSHEPRLKQVVIASIHVTMHNCTSFPHLIKSVQTLKHKQYNNQSAVVVAKIAILFNNNSFIALYFCLTKV